MKTYWYTQTLEIREQVLTTDSIHEGFFKGLFY